MHGKFPAIQQNQRNSILFHETIPLRSAEDNIELHDCECLEFEPKQKRY
jgi:hypothetical protein